MALSSGSAWYPIHHVETARPQLTLVHWVAFHAAAVALVLSLLLLLDTLDWGDWLGLRGLATFAVLLPFLWGMQALDHSSRLSPVISGGLAAACAAIALIAAPRIARESPLPRWRGCRAARELHYGPDGAWIWAQWRMVRIPVILLLLPVPLLITIQVLPLLGSGRLDADLVPLLRPVFTTVTFVSPVVLCIAAWFLGCSTTLLGAQSNAETFRWSLPLPRRRAQRLRLIFALALLVVAATPQLMIVLTRSLWLEPNAGATLAWRFSAQLCVAVAILAATHLCCAPLPLSSAVRNAGVLSASIALSVFIARTLTLSRPDLALASMVAVALLATAWAAAPRLDRWREI